MVGTLPDLAACAPSVEAISRRARPNAGRVVNGIAAWLDFEARPRGCKKLENSSD